MGQVMRSGESEMELWQWKQKKERDRKTVTGRRRDIARCSALGFEDGGRTHEPSSIGSILKLRRAGS